MTHPELAMDLVARLEVLISEPIDAGVTPTGHRRVIPITGGTVTGPRPRASKRPKARTPGSMTQSSSARSSRSWRVPGRSEFRSSSTRSA
jgi:hypothetical protein